MKSKRDWLAIVFLGIFLISLNFVFAANCGGETACSCGDTLTSSINLTQNVTGVENLIIAADNIVINGNGFTINCNINASNLTGNAFTGLNISNVTINGSIEAKGAIGSDELPYIYSAGSKLYIHPTDNSASAIWGCLFTTIGAGAQSDTNGSSNTIAIVNGCATAGIAAKLCSDLSYEGFDGWYLPAKDQLSTMYTQRNNVTKGNYVGVWADFLTAEYWSSTEYSPDPSTYAWYVNFNGGTSGYHGKSYPEQHTRCIRDGGESSESGAGGNITITNSTLNLNNSINLIGGTNGILTLNQSSLSNSNGRITFSYVSTNQTTFSDILSIENNSAYVNSTNYADYNVSANIILLNTGISNGLVLRDGILCPAEICSNLVTDEDDYSFDVTGWTNYSLTPDSDNDGIIDGTDKLYYNESNVNKTGVTNLNITIGGNSTSGSYYSGEYEVNFYDSSNLMINFTHNFTESELDLSKITIIKADNSIIVNMSGQLQGNKTLYITDNSFVSLCIKEAEISSISEVSSSCTGDNETDMTSCLGGSYSANGINCTDLGSTIQIDNLRYSAILGTQAAAPTTPSTSPSSSYSPQTYFSNEKLPTEGNNFSLRFNDKVKFVINSTNHTLTMQNFNTTHAKVKIQSDPLIAWLEKNVSYELDLDNDSVMDVKVMYGGRDNLGKAKMFIQEIVYPVEESLITDKESLTTGDVVEGIEKENGFNWIFCLLLLAIVVIIGFSIIFLRRKRRYNSSRHS